MFTALKALKKVKKFFSNYEMKAYSLTKTFKTQKNIREAIFHF